MKVNEIINEKNANIFKKGADDANKLAKSMTQMHSKIDAKLANTPSIAKTQQYKDYKKQNMARKKDAMKKGVPYGRQDVGETTTAGAIASVSAPMNGMKTQKRNPDGTAKNALDVDTNIMGNKKKAKKNKKD